MGRFEDFNVFVGDSAILDSWVLIFRQKAERGAKAKEFVRSKESTVGCVQKAENK